jgi:hypothetical protein
VARVAQHLRNLACGTAIPQQLLDPRNGLVEIAFLPVAYGLAQRLLSTR